MPQVKKAEKFPDLENLTVLFRFGDNEELVCKLTDVNDKIKAQLALHGISQKVGDSFAGAKDVDEAKEWAKETWETLLKGQWGTRTPGEGRSTLLAEAISRIAEVTIQEVKETLEAMDDDDIKELRKNDEIKLMMNTIRGERLKVKTEAQGKGESIRQRFMKTA